MRVFWPEAKSEVIKKTRRVAEHLLSLGCVVDVWLFGSYATDEFMHKSDLDLCIVVRNDSKTRGVDLMKEVSRLKTGMMFEFHIYTKDEFESLLQDSSSFVAREIVEKGIHLTEHT